jgi:hypothetical protein
MKRIACISTGVLVALSAVLGPTAWAAASTDTRARPVEGRIGIGGKRSTSTNWSGYAAFGQSFTEATGSWEAL